MDPSELSFVVLLSALAKRTLRAVSAPLFYCISVVKSWWSRTVPVPVAEPVAEPIAEPVSEPVVGSKAEVEPVAEPKPKSDVILYLEKVSDELAAEVSVVPPGRPQPGKFIIVSYSDTQEVRKTCGVFATFGTNKDLMSFLFGKEGDSYTLRAYVHPDWVELAYTGVYVENKIFQAERKDEVIYIVSNKDYGTGFITPAMRTQEINDRLYARSGQDSEQVNPEFNVCAHNDYVMAGQS